MTRFCAVLPSTAMRLFIAVLLIAAFSVTNASAQLQVIVRNDGKKMISNFGGASSGRNADLRWLAKQRNRRSPYDRMIERSASEYGVDPVLVRAVIQVESNFDPQ